ncbi:O-antigen ligase family protein [Sphingomonas phyllosphaerae]|uniref:O-antigen ligase family protein n=1 Tax=Sphingomonas phyllosphaerae TaxID=257003 RepID=UPI0004038D0F|nr:O-antigen ligase family protein [Sphingomonas phyllosphaerae]
MTAAFAAPLPVAVRGDALPRWLGLVGGFVLPMAAAMLYATYDIAMRSPTLEQMRQLGHLWLLGELALILHAVQCGFTMRAAWTALPRWARIALTLFLSTFWISSAFVSEHPDFSLGLTIGWAMQLLFAAALAYLAGMVPPARLAGVWHGFALGLAALAVAIAVHFTWLPAALRGWEHDINWGNAIPGFISVRLFGAWCGAVLALLTGVAWLSGGDARRRRALYLAMTLAFGMMFWSGTRAALLGWLCVLPVAGAMAGRPRSRAMLTTLPLYLLAGAALAILLQPYGHPAFTLFDAFNPEMNRSADSFSSGRLSLWLAALDTARHHPLLGTGAGSCWWAIHAVGQHHVQPHNAVVQFLLNWGIIPTLPALALLVGGTWNAHRRARAERALLPFVLMLDCLLVMSLLDGMLHFAQFVMLIVACLAISLAPRGTARALDR